MVSDFETTATDDILQEDTKVWSAASIDLNSPDSAAYAALQGSIEDYFKYLENRAKKENLCVYFHNLKFDGSFILDYLMRHPIYNEAIEDDSENTGALARDLPQYGGNYTYTYNISDKGLWYTIDIKVHGHYIQFRDSLKLLPFTLEELGKAFEVKHKKLNMKYTGDRYPNCPISQAEKDYIINDILCLKECMNIMFEQGHDKLTIGACCLSEFKKFYDKQDYKNFFPDLSEIPIYTICDDDIKNHDFGATDCDAYVRKSYHGGFCYVVPEKAGKVFEKGTDCDVNSLYPSMMHSDSGNYYPVGLPKFFVGKIPDKVIRSYPRFYYFVRFKCSFKIRKNFLPTVQIKDSPLFPARKWLTSSIVKDREGRDCNITVTLTMTQTDFELFKKHYHVKNLKILDGCYFYTDIGLFDDYINKYKEIKMKSKGAVRQIAKLFLNNLYGKLATAPQADYKQGYIDPKCNALRFRDMKGDKRPAGYIPIGSCITSYARRFTITAAQANYYGPYKRGFIYADTDSIHCDLDASEIVGAPKDPVKFNHWKYEASWDFGLFIRAKTYIERIVEEDEQPIEYPYFNLKCAGMPERCKDIFILSTLQRPLPLNYHEKEKKLTQDPNFTKSEFDYIQKGHNITDFDIGLTVEGALKSKRIKGGTVLIKQPYVMHKTSYM